eukprot:NODE_264_length_11354_cov_1.067170.p7 type:complete len:137 gc:universal NODE_264_length_11354_cov_1.067170:4308-3898(-)
MESMNIKPTSPSQTRIFLRESEEILFIGSAKERMSFVERTRWIALTDHGRLLVFQGKDLPNLPNKVNTLGRSFRSSLILNASDKLELSKSQSSLSAQDEPSVVNFSSGYKQKSSTILAKVNLINSDFSCCIVEEHR